MIVALGKDFDAETGAVVRTELGQSVMTTRPGRELSGNWFRPASGNLATGLSSTGPSFHSNWQSVVNAWRGVARASNVLEAEAKDCSASSGQAAPVHAAASSALRPQAAGAQQNGFMQHTAGREGAQPRASTSVWSAAPSAASQEISTGSAAGTRAERSETGEQDRVERKDAQSGQTGSTQATVTAAQTSAPAIAALVPPEVFASSPATVTLSQRSGTISSSSDASGLALAQGSAAAISGSALAASASEPATTGAIAEGFSAGGRSAGAKTRAMYSGMPSTARSAAMREAAAFSTGDTAEPASNPGTETQLSSPQAATTEANTERESTGAADSGGRVVEHAASPAKTGSMAQPTSAERGAQNVTPQANTSGAVPASADAQQDGATPVAEHTVTRLADHDASMGGTAAATPVVATQTASLDAAATVGLSTSAAPHVPIAVLADNQQSAAVHSAAMASHDAFAAIDTETSLGTPAWIHAGSQHAEAGFRDPDLGWVGVRAYLSAGGIHATLVPSSSEAAQALSGYLAGLSTHLAEQQSPVASLAMAAPGEGGGESSLGQGMQQGAEGNAQGSASEAARAGGDEGASAANAAGSAAQAQSGVTELLTQSGELRGVHISVMA